MRIWSMHPKYLDAKELVALWRETLLAKNVLEGKTKGYTMHPQLERFKATAKPLNYINFYLQEVWNEAKKRNYKFDSTKFINQTECYKIHVTKGQMEFEKQHLLKKLKERDPALFEKNQDKDIWILHPLFTIINGEIEAWERV